MSNIDDFRRNALIARGGGFKNDEIRHYKVLKKQLCKLDLKLGKPVEGNEKTKIYLDDKLNEFYGRKGICLKVFFKYKAVWGYEGAGGISTILESTIAQNLLAIKGLAGRVYDLVSIDGFTAQVTDYLTGSPGSKEIIDDRFEFYKDDISRDHNWRGGKLIDFQGTRLKDFSSYKNSLIKKTIKINREHGHSNDLYQSTDYHTGIRNTKERIKKYQFADFGKKIVLDIGCSNGMMCREAFNLGAKRVVGLDWPDMAVCARELAILDGYYNLDFYGIDLKTAKWEDIVKLTGISNYDIFLFLAMKAHIGEPEWLQKCKTIYFEGHGANREFYIKNN